jgi:hypothetical protein
VSAVSGTTGNLVYTIVTTGYENLFGRAVCGAGDLDGDGAGDFAVGVPNEDALAPNSGRTFIYRGAVTGLCALELLGTASVSAPVPPSLRILGCPDLPSFVLADLSPGPTPIPPHGSLLLGLTAALWPLNDPLGYLWPPFGNDIDSQGMLTLGPYALPPGSAGVTVYLQGFNPTPRAPNGAFQRTNGLAVAILP